MSHRNIFWNLFQSPQYERYARSKENTPEVKTVHEEVFVDYTFQYYKYLYNSQRNLGIYLVPLTRRISQTIENFGILEQRLLGKKIKFCKKIIWIKKKDDRAVKTFISFYQMLFRNVK